MSFVKCYQSLDKPVSNRSGANRRNGRGDGVRGGSVDENSPPNKRNRGFDGGGPETGPRPIAAAQPKKKFRSIILTVMNAGFV